MSWPGVLVVIGIGLLGAPILFGLLLFILYITYSLKKKHSRRTTTRNLLLGMISKNGRNELYESFQTFGISMREIISSFFLTLLYLLDLTKKVLILLLIILLATIVINYFQEELFVFIDDTYKCLVAPLIRPIFVAIVNSITYTSTILLPIYNFLIALSYYPAHAFVYILLNCSTSSVISLIQNILQIPVELIQSLIKWFSLGIATNPFDFYTPAATILTTVNPVISLVNCTCGTLGGFLGTLTSPLTQPFIPGIVNHTLNSAVYLTFRISTTSYIRKSRPQTTPIFESLRSAFNETGELANFILGDTVPAVIQLLEGREMGGFLSRIKDARFPFIAVIPINSGLSILNVTVELLINADQFVEGIVETFLRNKNETKIEIARSLIDFNKTFESLYDFVPLTNGSVALFTSGTPIDPVRPCAALTVNLTVNSFYYATTFFRAIIFNGEVLPFITLRNEFWYTGNTDQFFGLMNDTLISYLNLPNSVFTLITGGANESTGALLYIKEFLNSLSKIWSSMASAFVDFLRLSADFYLNLDLIIEQILPNDEKDYITSPTSSFNILLSRIEATLLELTIQIGDLAHFTSTTGCLGFFDNSCSAQILTIECYIGDAITNTLQLYLYMLEYFVQVFKAIYSLTISQLIPDWFGEIRPRILTVIDDSLNVVAKLISVPFGLIHTCDKNCLSYYLASIFTKLSNFLMVPFDIAFGMLDALADYIFCNGKTTAECQFKTNFGIGNFTSLLLNDTVNALLGSMDSAALFIGCVTGEKGAFITIINLFKEAVQIIIKIGSELFIDLLQLVVYLLTGQFYQFGQAFFVLVKTVLYDILQVVTDVVKLIINIVYNDIILKVVRLGFICDICWVIHYAIYAITWGFKSIDCNGVCGICSNGGTQPNCSYTATPAPPHKRDQQGAILKSFGDIFRPTSTIAPELQMGKLSEKVNENFDEKKFVAMQERMKDFFFRNSHDSIDAAAASDDGEQDAQGRSKRKPITNRLNLDHIVFMKQLKQHSVAGFAHEKRDGTTFGNNSKITSTMELPISSMSYSFMKRAEGMRGRAEGGSATQSEEMQMSEAITNPTYLGDILRVLSEVDQKKRSDGTLTQGAIVFDKITCGNKLYSLMGVISPDMSNRVSPNDQKILMKIYEVCSFLEDTFSISSPAEGDDQTACDEIIRTEFLTSVENPPQTGGDSSSPPASSNNPDSKLRSILSAQCIKNRGLAGILNKVVKHDDLIDRDFFNDPTRAVKNMIKILEKITSKMLYSDSLGSLFGKLDGTSVASIKSRREKKYNAQWEESNSKTSSFSPSIYSKNYRRSREIDNAANPTSKEIDFCSLSLTNQQFFNFVSFFCSSSELQLTDKSISWELKEYCVTFKGSDHNGDIMQNNRKYINPDQIWKKLCGGTEMNNNQLIFEEIKKTGERLTKLKLSKDRAQKTNLLPSTSSSTTTTPMALGNDVYGQNISTAFTSSLLNVHSSTQSGALLNIKDQRIQQAFAATIERYHNEKTPLSGDLMRGDAISQIKNFEKKFIEDGRNVISFHKGVEKIEEKTTKLTRMAEAVFSAALDGTQRQRIPKIVSEFQAEFINCAIVNLGVSYVEHELAVLDYYFKNCLPLYTKYFEDSFNMFQTFDEPVCQWQQAHLLTNPHHIYKNGSILPIDNLLSNSFAEGKNRNKTKKAFSENVFASTIFNIAGGTWSIGKQATGNLLDALPGKETARRMMSATVIDPTPETRNFKWYVKNFATCSNRGGSFCAIGGLGLLRGALLTGVLLLIYMVLVRSLLGINIFLEIIFIPFTFLIILWMAAYLYSPMCSGQIPTCFILDIQNILVKYLLPPFIDWGCLLQTPSLTSTLSKAEASWKSVVFSNNENKKMTLFGNVNQTNPTAEGALLYISEKDAFPDCAYNLTFSSNYSQFDLQLKPKTLDSCLALQNNILFDSIQNISTSSTPKDLGDPFGIERERKIFIENSNKNFCAIRNSSTTSNNFVVCHLEYRLIDPLDSFFLLLHLIDSKYPLSLINTSIPVLYEIIAIKFIKEKIERYATINYNECSAKACFFLTSGLLIPLIIVFFLIIIILSFFIIVLGASIINSFPIFSSYKQTIQIFIMEIFFSA